MTDRLTKERRSWNMSRIKSGGTKPERIVRSVLHRMGYRFRLSTGKQMPGRPDLVLAKHRVAVFVHGCFWHRHAGCPFAYTPKSRIEFWTAKFDQNIDRDRRVVRQLKRLGWRICTIWECECRDERKLQTHLKRCISRRVSL